MNEIKIFMPKDLENIIHEFKNQKVIPRNKKNNMNHIEDELKLNNCSFDIFNDGGTYIDNAKIFYAYYSQIPSIKVIQNIDALKFKKVLLEKSKNDILKKHCKQIYLSDEKEKMHFVDLILLMKDGTLLNLGPNDFCVLYTDENESNAQKWIDKAFPFIVDSGNKNEIKLITSGSQGLKSSRIEFKKQKVDLKLNYNDDILPIHKELVSKLNVKEANGLFLFHGKPGTGKSTYIKYLIQHVKKDVIFMSPKMAGSIDAPELTGFLLRNRNTIIVIEDAEELIGSRENVRNSTISTLLNLTDGLLGDCLGIQIIATFNTHVSNIDKALLRKGRLKLMYEFNELSTAKAKKIFNKLGITNTQVEKPLTLAEIFNMKETNFQFKIERQAIGFVQ